MFLAHSVTLLKILIKQYLLVPGISEMLLILKSISLTAASKLLSKNLLNRFSWFVFCQCENGKQVLLQTWCSRQSGISGFGQAIHRLDMSSSNLWITWCKVKYVTTLLFTADIQRNCMSVKQTLGIKCVWFTHTFTFECPLRTWDLNWIKLKKPKPWMLVTALSNSQNPIVVF